MIESPGWRQSGHVELILEGFVGKNAVPSSSLAAYVENLFRDLARRLPTAFIKSQPEAIHKVRVTTRRIHAVIGLLHSHLKSKDVRALEGTLRKLRRRLGRIRDTDVMIGR